MILEQATFGAGCFWGAEAFFREAEGVVDARVGHATGSDGSTPSARIEVVQVDFDPSRVSYETLVNLFWQCHDPTSFDRQGDETGESVRSAIFTHSAKQAEIAERLRANFGRNSEKPAVTQIIAYVGMELAAEEHQRYIEKNGGHACVVKPVAKSEE
ncbi:MAG: peptide-methionine (S)-S-oxide reductase MsrA [Candidatus Accumulibacter sp.]|nr:peptide-methionine (S)-S-oxide reductase MsrA [Accumulibacter sp.]